MSIQPVRHFPRGVILEQQLDKQKRLREQRDKRYKPVDPERDLRLKQAESKLEERLIGKGEAAFDKFLLDST